SGAHAKAEFENHEVQLPLAEDRAEPHQWRTTFWPRRAGWHKVQLGSDGAQIDFFVQEANAWSSLGTARRTRATQIAAAQSQGRASAGFQQPEHVSAGVNVGVVIALYTLFLASGSYLWLERRRASG
ncbi:MAG TPA: hypothetical protein VK993_03165, partial [Chthoniobacterales bacterium]|nr:hypothetical protein [Chthoniobacterales bacterium]